MDKPKVLRICLNEAIDFDVTIKLGKLFQSDKHRLKNHFKIYFLTEWLLNYELIASPFARSLSNIKPCMHR